MRWVFRIVGILLLLVVLGVAAIFLIPKDRIAAVVIERFADATGRELSIAGDIRPTLWPDLGVRTGAIAISNAEWAGDEAFLVAQDLAVGVDLGALIGGEVRIKQIEILAPTIALRRDAEGRANWDFSKGGAEASSAPAEASGTLPPFTIDEARIVDGAVSYRDAAGADYAVSGLDARFTLPAFDGPASLSATGRVNTADAALSAEISSFSRFLAGGEDAISAVLSAGGARAQFDGTVALADIAADGQISVSGENLGQTLAALGLAAADIPEGLGRNQLALDAALAFADDTLGLTDATVTLDQNRIGGDITVALDGLRPKISGALALGDLDLSALGGGDGDESQEQADGPGGWSTEPIDVSGLGAVDADLTISANSMAVGTARMQNTRLGVVLDNARMVTAIRELNAYDGQVTGQFVINGRNGLSASTDLAGSAVSISRLLSELFEYDRLTALGDMELSVLGVGNSMNALMNSLNGEGSIRFGAGELLGLDLVGMLKNLDTSFIGDNSRTIFDSITATFRIVDGVVINENLLIDAPLLIARGSGEIGLGGQTLNYRLVPSLRSGEDEGLSVPLIITGTWDAPRFRLDMEALLEGRAAQEIEAAKDRLEQSVRDRVSERLGIGQTAPETEAAPLAEQQPQSAEEAVKDKVEEELKRGLRGLFDR